MDIHSDIALPAITIDTFLQCCNQAGDLEDDFLSSRITPSEYAVALDPTRTPILEASLLFGMDQFQDFITEVNHLLGFYTSLMDMTYYRACAGVARTFGLEYCFGITFLYNERTEDMEYSTLFEDNLIEAIRSGQDVDAAGYIHALNSIDVVEMAKNN